ncbi:TPA: diaminopimelate decarboxylase [Staphylococcus pseudintermedius]|uniref:diaminopimelate decarboxylase n=1 Tax=Staphylococcus pseudintermedius TaxID=283734 RepID=UPI00111D01F0|nr:diaminopimelate decarboxylase [Staphylococcus pseudintermedius]EGQ1316235.1 diaminopimelate decarboxylase [Staphylococcus pseudintermedius]EGQ1721890.1 diaminopimelate decarboxylase [Staphylococcus pseudintermedius]EGQ2995679.1 diaminopimelate decarboxylase [Staphylococcus pseudintermedius]EGQ3330648.1 diaminopimelate decarboxylase [Staphylococcus pseudintermedius]EGQ3518015.1 diaminopimelate decarboxylase [Staphylococcus pseudintermedius]
MTVSYNQNGELTLGGTSLKTLAQSFGTPTIVYDEAQIRQQMRRYHSAFQQNDIGYVLSYASKAFTCLQMVKLAAEEDFELDVVSEGELYTALEAGFDPQRIHFHGNNKTKHEIRYALESGIGYFVVDALDEIDLIEQYATKPVDVLLRVNPGVEAHTHEFIQTGQEKSKFGLSLKHGLALEAVEKIRNTNNIVLKGIHFHIGSQIEETTGMIETAKMVLNWLDEHAITIDLLNLGGGFSAQYVEGDQSFDIEVGITEIVQAIKAECQQLKYPIPTLSIEPGRSIVAEAGVTLYEVGTIKDIPGVNKYVSIDGGMSDHIRTALYDAKYQALLINRNETPDETVTIAGKLCESGDIIIHEAKLPSSVKRGDYLAILATGAYHYSMASNYNQMQKPSVFFVKDGKAREVVKRQSLRQLIINDVK